MKTEPHRSCGKCPRLKRYIGKCRQQEPDWFNAPVPTWEPEAGVEHVKLLVVGLAPGLRGANRTGRAFTGDASGALLFANLVKFGFATGSFENTPSDSIVLNDCAITNAVRCVPPQNRPTGSEIAKCQKFLAPTINTIPNLTAILTLGKIAHESTVRTLQLRVADYPFGHGARFDLGGKALMSSYHCSRYNVNTGRLTEVMFEDVFRKLRQQIGDRTQS